MALFAALVLPSAANDLRGQVDMDKNAKLSEAALKKLLGTTTSLPSGKGANWDRKEPPSTAKDTKIDPAEIRNPKLTLERRERESGMKCGGKVRKMAAGGSVRGVGCATKGTKFKGSY